MFLITCQNEECEHYDDTLPAHCGDGFADGIDPPLCLSYLPCPTAAALAVLQDGPMPVRSTPFHYFRLLSEGYKASGHAHKLAYLAEDIFHINTHDPQMAKLFGEKALAVLNAITEEETLLFAQSSENYHWYLIMVNMPFFKDKLEWATSFKVAWWNIGCYESYTINSTGLLDGDNQILELQLDADEWTDFILAINVFIKD